MMENAEQGESAQWTPTAIKATAKTEQGKVELARLAAEGSADFVSTSETLITGTQRPKPDRASTLALNIMKRYPGGEGALAEKALEAGMATAGLLERVAARSAAKSGDRDRAIRLRRAAISLEPEKAHRYIALARTLQSETATGIVLDPLIGLTQGQTQTHAAEIEELFQTARTLAPSNAYVLFELGKCLLSSGQIHEGLLLLRRASLRNPDSKWKIELAQAYRRPEIARFSDSFEAYSDVLYRAPHNSKALAGLIHTGARGPMDWHRLWPRVTRNEKAGNASAYKRNKDLRHRLDALFKNVEELTGDEASSLVKLIEKESREGLALTSHTMNAIILRLQFLGHFSAGFQLRTQLATERMTNLRRKGVKSIADFRQLMKALVYLDRHESAREVSADAAYWAQGDPLIRKGVEKLHADAALMSGEIGPYLEFSDEARETSPLIAENRMEDLIGGKRIAIVGPAATKEQLGGTIDSYDVVVRPNFSPQLIGNNPKSMGSRTDVAYYSGQDMTKLIDDVESLVQASPVKIINTRSFSYQAYNHRQIPWLRFSRNDWSLSFHGSPLGIQRMIYDLLQFDPKEIGIFNSDFYTGDGEFTEGYRSERSFGPGSFKNDLLVVHDLLTDFRFTQAMLKTGRVTAQGRAAEVLEMTPEEYLRQVEAAGVLA